MKFFFDNNLSESLVNGLDAFGENVIHLKAVFQEDVEDIEWLKHIGKNKFILITRDLKIKRRPAEIQALRTYKVGAFFLGGKHRSKCQLIQQVVRNWPRIKGLAKKTRSPYAFRVPPRGTSIKPMSL